MNGEFDATGSVLKYGVIVGAAVIAVGVLGLFLGADWHMAVLTAGVVIVLVTPFLGLFTVIGRLALDGDVKWALVALLVIVITVSSAAIAWAT